MLTRIKAAVPNLIRFSTIPARNYWMFAVDGKFYAPENGPEEFEKREANSVEGTLNGLLVSINNIGNDITIKHICEIHKACMTKVPSRNPCIPGEFRKVLVTSELQKPWATVAGLKNFLQREDAKLQIFKTDDCLLDGKITKLAQLSLDEVKKCKLLFPRNQPLQLLEINDELVQRHHQCKIALAYLPIDPALINPKMITITRSLNQLLTNNLEPTQLLKAIIIEIQQYLRTHAFQDGNIRSYINCLFNNMLVESGISTPLFYFDPNVFEGHSPDELVIKIKEAKEVVDRMIAHPNQPVFDYDPRHTPEKFINIGERFLAGLMLAMNKFGVYLYTQKAFNEAADLFEACLQIPINHPNDQLTSFYLNLGSCRRELGQLFAAKGEFLKAKTYSDIAEKSKKIEGKITEIDKMISIQSNALTGRDSPIKTAALTLPKLDIDSAVVSSSKPRH